MRKRIALVSLAIVVGVVAVVSFAAAAGSNSPDLSPGFGLPDWFAQAWQANEQEVIAEDEIPTLGEDEIPAPAFEGPPPPQFGSWEEYAEFLAEVYDSDGVAVDGAGRPDVIVLDTDTEGCLVEVVFGHEQAEIVRVETECEAGPPVPEVKP
jgi:hypothetical protein